MKIAETLYSTALNKCPRCHKGDVFIEKNPYKLTTIFKINERCPHCDLKFEKEPSFFYGAMYASYALTAGWFIVWYVLYATVLSGMDTMTFALLLAFSILVLSPLTLRLSRLLWLNFFFKYDSNFSKNKKTQTQ